MEASSLTNDELIDEVTTWAARVARGEALHLELIGELDVREAWAGHGVTSCGLWLSWKLGWSMTTANERLRVARALRTLPLLSAAFSVGTVSYSQVRAVTRVATAETESGWLDLALHATGAMLDKAARGADRARAAEQDPDTRPHKQAARVEWDNDGDLVLTLRLPAHQAVPVLAALEQHRAAEQTERDAALAELVTELLIPGTPAEVGRQQAAPAPETPRPSEPLASDRASAEAPTPASMLEQVYTRLDPFEPYPYVEPAYPISEDRFWRPRTPAEDAAIERWQAEKEHQRAIRDAWNDRREQLLLEASARRVATGRVSLADALVRLVLRPADCAPVTVQLLTDPLSGWARTQHDELLPPAAVAEILRTLPVRTNRRGPAPLELSCRDQGRATRLVTPALRRLLGQVDGERCRFPGCRHTRNLHAHHVRYWRHGGRTDLANLLLVCGKHHRLLHEAGYQLTLHPDRTVTVAAPDGTQLEHHPVLPDASAEALPPAQPDTLPPHYLGDRFELGYVVNVMLAHAA